MELYYHKTDLGAEYYSTSYTRNPDGSLEGTMRGAILRTDGDEIEIFADAIEAQGLKLVVTGQADTIRRALAYKKELEATK